MRIKKVPCLAWIRHSKIPENVGIVVEVTGRAPDIRGIPFWYVTSKNPTRGVDAEFLMVLPVKFNDGVCEDECLTPINDPDADVGDVGEEKAWTLKDVLENENV